MNAWKAIVSAVFLTLILSSCDDGQSVSFTHPEPVKPTELPKEFLIYNDALQLSEQRYLKVTPTVSKGMDVKDSKFRGIPFLPKGHEYPVNKKAERLVLLAQINFEEAPALKGFPNDGVLQFYIDPGINKEHVWGMSNYQGKPWKYEEFFQTLQVQDYFKVLYFPVEVLHSSESSKKYVPYIGHGMPISAPMKLSFEIESEYVNVEDYRFEQYLGLSVSEFYKKHEGAGWKSLDAFYQYLLPDAIAKIGGYGRFVQNDPRSMNRIDEEWIVLLNIDSAPVGDEDILWGDGGVGSFLIRKRDLDRLDFSNVAYYWDNH